MRFSRTLKSGTVILASPLVLHEVIAAVAVESARREPLTYPPDYDYPAEKTVALNPRALAQSFFRSARRHQLMIDNLRARHPNFFAYVTGSRYNQIRTGTEQNLQDWILRQPENSVTPEDLFEASAALCEREEYGCTIGGALVAAHNVLRDNARYKADYIRYPTNAKTRKAVFNKLRDIRGDLVESGRGHGDHAGSWYRLFGMLAHTYGSGITDQSGAAKVAGNFFLAPKQKMIASLAENVKPYFYLSNGQFGEQDLYGKLRVNSTAVEVGLALLDELRTAD